MYIYIYTHTYICICDEPKAVVKVVSCSDMGYARHDDVAGHSRVILEYLLSSHLVEKFSAVLNSKFPSCVGNSRPQGSVHLSTALPRTPRPPTWFLSLQFL
jgi:hypothetical protein